MIIKFFPKYSYSGASSRYRTFQYVPLFEKEGITCKIYPFFNDKHIQNINNGNKKKSVFLYLKYLFKRMFLVLFLKKDDVIFIEKELIPYFPPVLEWYLSVRKIKFILDYDDAIIHNYDKSSNKIVRKLLSRKIPYIQKKANIVINGSKYLMKLSEKNNKNSIYIPTSLNIEKYIPRQKNGNKFIVGWIGSYSTSKLIAPLLDAIIEFCVKNNAEIHLIGFNPAFAKNKNPDILKVIQWSEKKEISEINNFNVGISPSIDTPFARGKCAFKSVQYMACSKPVITSPVGANADVVKHGITGFHANTENDWIKYLEFFLLNSEKAEQMGKKGREYIEAEFSIQVNYKKYIQIFESLKKL